MFSIANNGIITVNRGDSFELPLRLNVGTSLDQTLYTLTDTDVVYIGVMEPQQNFEDAILRKRVTKENVDDNGTLIVRFWPEDTCCLTPGKYYYQVKITTVDEKTKRTDVETILNKTLFYILE